MCPMEKNIQLLSLWMEGDNLTTLAVPTVIAALVTEPGEAESSRWYTDRKFTISITAFLLILPLSIPKEIGFQKYARWVGRALRGWEPPGCSSQHPPKRGPRGCRMETLWF